MEREGRPESERVWKGCGAAICPPQTRRRRAFRRQRRRERQSERAPRAGEALARKSASRAPAARPKTTTMMVMTTMTWMFPSRACSRRTKLPYRGGLPLTLHPALDSDRHSPSLKENEASNLTEFGPNRLAFECSKSKYKHRPPPSLPLVFKNAPLATLGTASTCDRS